MEKLRHNRISQSSRRLQRATQNISKQASNALNKSAVGLARWAATDHYGINKALSDMPELGAWESIKYTLWHVFASVCGGLVAAAAAFVLIAYVIPFLLCC